MEPVLTKALEEELLGQGIGGGIGQGVGGVGRGVGGIGQGIGGVG